MTAVARFEPDYLQQLLDEELGALTDGVPAALWERALIAPARDLLSRPGKRFRANLVAVSWQLSGADPGAMPAGLAAAVEVLHAGSLIIDDIEDEATVRRGAPALHHLHGVPVALNTGNWMYFWAFTIADRATVEPTRQPAIMRAMINGVARCHQGQALDVGIDVGTLTPALIGPVVRRATELKAGALTELATTLGAIAAGAEPEALAGLTTFGRELGVGLQMLDDLGSVTCPSRLDKACEDLSLARPTWPWVWAIELATPADQTALLACGRRVSAAHRAQQGDAREIVEALASELGARVDAHGRAVVRAHLDGALMRLRTVFPRAAGVHLLEDELHRLEASYG